MSSPRGLFPVTEKRRYKSEGSGREKEFGSLREQMLKTDCMMAVECKHAE